MIEIEFDQKDKKYIVAEYRERRSMASIGAEYGVSAPTIRKVLESAGVPIRGRGGADPKKPRRKRSKKR